MIFVFFATTFQACVGESLDSGRSYNQVIGLVFIQSCYFSRKGVTIGHGGVVYLDNTNSQMEIYDSGFYNCSSSLRGGAVLCYITSYAKVARCCGYMCKSGDLEICNFIEIMTNNNIFMNMTSCLKSSYSYSSWMSIYFSLGNQVLKNTNISKSKNLFASTISSWRPISLDLSHCLFENNEAYEDTSLFLIGGSGSRVLSYNNFINNTQRKSANGFIFVNENGAFSLENTILDRNSGCLFYVLAGSLSVSNCHINNYQILSSGQVTTNNIGFGHTNTIHLILHRHQFCEEKNLITHIVSRNRNIIFFLLHTLGFLYLQ